MTVVNGKELMELRGKVNNGGYRSISKTAGWKGDEQKMRRVRGKRMVAEEMKWERNKLETEEERSNSRFSKGID